MFDSMFQMPLPVLEKILRPIIVYLFLVIFLRIFGKRELAQLNPFDLVVLLSLSNTVQNAIIGNDNSVTGGMIGTKTVLIKHGVVDSEALSKETMTEIELLSVIHKQGLNEFSEVETCVLEPNGGFYVEAMKPSHEDTELTTLQESLNALMVEVKAMRAQLAGR